MSTIKHFTRMVDATPDYVSEIVNNALHFKTSRTFPDLKGKILGNIFFNSSLRTRMSFEAAMIRAGGQAISVTPGSGTWAFETDFGVRMDSDKPEHIKEAIRVMARYVDILGVRTFASLSSLQDDAEERVLSAFEEYSTVPLVSLESAMEHPCQMIADMLTIRERLSETRGKTFCLRWAPHIKSLPMAVPNSAALAGALLGMNLTIAAPKGYELHERYSTRLQQLCDASGTTFQHVTSLNEIPSDCEILYVKSWGAPEFYGNPTAQTKSFESHKSWIVDENDLGSTAYLMHCLPVRRNVVVSDRALDHERSVIIDQAENRLWGQLAVLNDLRA